MLFTRWQHHLRFCSGFPYAPLKAMVTMPDYIHDHQSLQQTVKGPGPVVPWHVLSSGYQPGSCEHLESDSGGTHRCPAAPLRGCTESDTTQPPEH